MSSKHDVAAAMALEVRHRIHRGFEVKPNAGFSPQQSQQQQQQQQQQRQQQQQPRGAAAAPQEATAQSIDAGPRLRKESSHLHSASLSAKAPFSPAAREREPDGFHDWHPHGYSVSRPKHNSTAAAASAPAGRGTWLPDSERSDVGVRGFVSMCSAARSIAAVDSPTTLRQHRVEVVGTVHTRTGVRRLIRSVTQGLRACQEPEAAEAGLGGTYFFKNEAGRKIGIVKPIDEEPLAPNNPKGFVGRALGDPGLKPTVRVGEAALREVAAFLLDHDGFAKVPPTVLVIVTHPIFHVAAAPATPPPGDRTAGSRALSPLPMVTGGGHDHASSSVGSTASCGTALGASPLAAAVSAPDGPPAKYASLQEFVSHECDTSELGPSRFATTDVHRIGILDVRLYNTDRHAGNMLVRRPRGASTGGGYGGGLARLAEARLELCPIDHGFCLPEGLEPPYFEWLHWPQAMIPFDDEELEYIARLDARADADLLRRELPSLRDSCLRTMEVSTTLLQACAASGMSLSEIGAAMSRPLVGIDEEPSELERVCLRVREIITRQSDGMSGVAGDFDDTDSDADSDSHIDLEELQPMNELSFSQVARPASTALATDPANQATVLGAAGDLEGLGHSTPRACVGSRCGQEPVPCMSCSDGLSRGAASSALGPVSEDDSWHGVSLLTGALNPGSAAAPASGGTSFSREYGLSREHSRGSSSVNTGSSAGAIRATVELDTASGGVSGRGVAPESQPGGSGRLADDLVFDFDGGEAAPQTPRLAGVVPQAGFQTPSPQRRRRDAGLGGGGGSSAPPDGGGTPLSYSHYGAASLLSPPPPQRRRALAPLRRSRSGGQPLGAADGTQPASPSTPSNGRRQLRGLLNADSLTSDDTIFGSRSGHGTPTDGGGLMAMSMVLPTLIGRGGGHRGVHRTRSRHHTAHKGLKPKALAYPPPIEGGAPAAVNDLFSDLTPPLWDNFMAALKGEIEEALASGEWRAERTPGPQAAALGTSCPRF